MIGRRACLIAAISCGSPCAALGEDAAAVTEPGRTIAIVEQQPLAASNPDFRQPPPRGNPISRIPIDSLFFTRERPLFSASRRPPPPPPTLASSPAPTADSSPPAELERPPLKLQGTAIGKPRDIALVLDETTKGFVGLHVGEASEGWSLRSIDPQTVMFEKDNRLVILSFPAPGAAPSGPANLASDRSNQPRSWADGRPPAKGGANWISIAHASY